MFADDESREELKVLLPYFAPYLLLWPFQAANSWHPNAMYVTYPLKTIVIAIALICLRRNFPELQWKWSFHGVWVGLLALAVWLVPYWKFIPGLPAPEVDRGGFNPLQFDKNPLTMYGLIVFRLAGASLVIPFVEELLFRSCIARLVISQDFKRLPIGTFSWASLAITTIAFTIGHRPWEWVGAILVGLLYYWLVVWRKNILDCIVAHGVTNLTLGIYILRTREWFWW
jgi:hypothetical protein